MATIDTPKAAGFRRLAFTTIAEALREGERIAAAETAGGLARIGNWTPGQAFGHIAAWINFGFDGFPPEFRPPWAVRMLMKLMKSSFINKPMRRGVRIPGLAAGTLAMDPLPTERGLHLLRQALARLEAGRRSARTRSWAR